MTLESVLNSQYHSIQSRGSLDSCGSRDLMVPRKEIHLDSVLSSSRQMAVNFHTLNASAYRSCSPANTSQLASYRNNQKSPMNSSRISKMPKQKKQPNRNTNFSNLNFKHQFPKVEMKEKKVRNFLQKEPQKVEVDEVKIVDEFLYTRSKKSSHGKEVIGINDMLKKINN